MELSEALITIADSLREERTRAGLTLEQLAQRAELSTAHLSRLESGDRQPSVAALIALSRALGVSMSTLLGERRGAPAVATYAAERRRTRPMASRLRPAAASRVPPRSRRCRSRSDLTASPLSPHVTAARNGSSFSRGVCGSSSTVRYTSWSRAPRRTSTRTGPTGSARRAGPPRSSWSRPTRRAISATTPSSAHPLPTTDSPEQEEPR